MLEQDYLFEIGGAIEKIGYKCCVVAGGSYSYKYSLFQSLSEIRDLDLLIFLENREKLTDFITVHQTELDQILHLENVECHFGSEDIVLLSQDQADGLRYSGLNDLGQKISVKFLPYDYIQKILNTEKSGRINIISSKDKRFYDHKTLAGSSVKIGVVNQRINDRLCLLGDPDLLQIGNEYCLGVIADVLLSGKIIYQSENVNVDNLKKILINKVSKKAKSSFEPLSWSDILIRSERLPADFKKSFCDQFPKIDNPSGKTSLRSDYTVALVSPIIRGKYTQINLTKEIDSEITKKRYLKSSGPFSSNSNYGLAVFKSGEKSFFKEMLNEFRFRGELYGLITASAYFPHLRKPIYTNPNLNLVAYDWYPGDIMARKRLDYIDENTFNKIIDVELKRAEDHLNAYIHSAYDLFKSDKKTDIYGSRIHDLFYGRLMNNRFENFYHQEPILSDEQALALTDLAEFPFNINGKHFPSINELIGRAKNILNPDSVGNTDLVCGLGDAHSGNIMTSFDLNDYAYIDYEFAGYHSPYLDIAKQLYNDTSYELLYCDKLPPKEKKVDISFKDNTIFINHDYRPDKISRYIYKTKFEGIILPYRHFCKNKKIPLASNWKDILGLASFCCGLLTRNISEFNKSDFILNLANSIESSDIDYYSDKFK